MNFTMSPEFTDEIYPRMMNRYAEEDLSAQYLFFYEMSLPFGLDLNTTLSQDRSSTKLIASLKEMGAEDYKKFD